MRRENTSQGYWSARARRKGTTSPSAICSPGRTARLTGSTYCRTTCRQGGPGWDTARLRRHRREVRTARTEAVARRTQL